jgi:transcriptional regulator with XRE-family HTH domain
VQVFIPRARDGHPLLGVVRAADFAQRELARLAGVSEPYVCHVTAGRRPPSKRLVAAAVQLTRVPRERLSPERGRMTNDDPSETRLGRYGDAGHAFYYRDHPNSFWAGPVVDGWNKVWDFLGRAVG